MFHYNFVYYFLILIYFVSANDAVETRSGPYETISIVLNSTMEEHCHEIKKSGFSEKKTCLEDFLGAKPTASGSNCTSIQNVERVFMSVFNRTLDCYVPMFIQENVNSALQMRLDLLKQAMDKAKYFLDNGGGSDCIGTKKNEINECIFGNIHGKNRTHIENSEVRQGPLFFSKQTCSRSTVIVECIREALEQNCTSTSVQFIISLNKPLKDRCNNITETEDSSMTSKPNKGGFDYATGNIIIGSLVGIIVVLIAAVLIDVKLRKRSSPSV